MPTDVEEAQGVRVHRRVESPRGERKESELAFMKRKSDEIQNLRADLGKKFGVKRVLMANEMESLDVIPTGVMALDYALGVGGWPRRHAVGVFGPPDVGKSSVLGL